ncbi:hypothetical protein HOF65_06285 [bacterium]|nr:hypothetical protein [bacterium]
MATNGSELIYQDGEEVHVSDMTVVDVSLIEFDAMLKVPIGVILSIFEPNQSLKTVHK